MSEKQAKKIVWGAEKVNAFEKLKDAIIADVELAYADYSEEAALLELAVDASDVGMGACLLQKQWERI